MSDLTEFLLARIAEDEAVARDAEPGPWRLDDEYIPTQAIGADGDPVIRAASGDRDWTFQTTPVAHHVVRWDPARVLAECEAKRRIVELASTREQDELSMTRGRVHAGLTPFRFALRTLAQPYANHPDYREEWRP